MTSRLFQHRVYFFIVIWFTSWVGAIGYFRPDEILRALSWPVPALHARFIGALYLSATVFLLISLFARTLAQMKIIVVIAFVWTGWLLLITFIHWSTFDFAKPQPWFWVVAYLLFPLMAAWLAWQTREPKAASPATGPRWIAVFFLLQGSTFTVLALVCFIVPAEVGRLWPWKISPFLAQVYSGPLLGYGIGGLLLGIRRIPTETWIPTAGLLIFAVLALIASLRHLALFTPGSPSAIGWFAGLAALGLGSAAVLLSAALPASPTTSAR